MDLALNNPQSSTCHKTQQPTNQLINHYFAAIEKYDILLFFCFIYVVESTRG